MEPSVLLTGTTGFIGSRVVAEVDRRGIRFSTLGRRVPERAGGHGGSHFGADVATMPKELRDIVLAARPTHVLHLIGAQPSMPPAEAYAVNVAFFRRLLDALEPVQPVRIITLGSASEYGRTLLTTCPTAESDVCQPASTYGISKYAQTLEALSARDQGHAVTVARLFNVVGASVPPFLAIGRFLAKIAALPPTGGRLAVGPLDRWRDFIDVNETASALVDLCLDARDLPPVLNVCSGEGTCLRDWIDALIQGAGKPVIVDEVLAPHTFDPIRAVGDPGLLKGFGYKLAPARIASVAGLQQAPVGRLSP